MSLIDVVGFLLLGKAITAAIVPIGVLLLCSMAKHGENPGSPLQLCRVRGTTGEDAPVVILRVWSMEVNVSNFLSADEVLTRLAIWSEIGVAWGPMACKLKCME